MWLLGAGASANANVPTAYDLIWEFKRDIFCSRERQSIALLRDLTDPGVRQRLQDYFDHRRDLPAAEDVDEYAAFFEAAYPSEQDRRQFLDPKMRGARASYGHLALAALMVMDRVRLVWTTNFDTCIEDAHSYVTGSTAGLVTITPETSTLADEALREDRWPLQVKLHGDFRYRRLRNTPGELREQDANLRRILVSRCGEQGLAVVGYSGRDDSVMRALGEALESGSAFPGGLFWFHRPDTPLLPGVRSLLECAAGREVETHLVPIPTFDELGGDLLVLYDLPVPIDEKLKQARGSRPHVPAPILVRDGTYPLIRFNALPLDVPTQCRFVVCTIGGAAEVQAAVAAAGKQVIAGRRAQGILAFGRDDDVRETFEAFGITAFDIFPIADQRLRFDSGELGLIYDGITLALSRHLPLRESEPTGRSHMLVLDPQRGGEDIYRPLSEAVNGPVAGTIPKTSLPWAEGMVVHIERRLDRNWLCLEPVVTAPRSDDPAVEALRTEFLRERRARRYNVVATGILDAWVMLLTQGREAVEYSAFGCTDGVDAVYGIHRRSAFSGRGKR